MCIVPFYASFVTFVDNDEELSVFLLISSAGIVAIAMTSFTNFSFASVVVADNLFLVIGVGAGIACLFADVFKGPFLHFPATGCIRSLRNACNICLLRYRGCGFVVCLLRY
jgi:hypothetical protein